MASLPLGFEPNVGNAESRIRYLARGAHFGLYVTADSLAMTRWQPSDAVRDPRTGAGVGIRTTRSLAIQFVGASASSTVVAERPLAGTVNYLRGADPTRWRTDVRRYAGVRCQGLYPGVDLAIYGNQTDAEYDLVVAPNADPGVVALRFSGATQVRLDPDGALVLDTDAGTVKQGRPVVYQQIDGVRRPVSARYTIASDGAVGFCLGAYDPAYALVIDPTLGYSTYLGGLFDETGFGIVVDRTGSAYVTGMTSSPDFHILNAAQPVVSVYYPDAFVTKFAPGGAQIEYSTFIGGNYIDIATGIAIDAGGSAYVSGFTGATDFPVANAFQPQNNTSTDAGLGVELFDAFVTKLSPEGNAFLYSTYLGGSDWEFASHIAIDATGAAYVVGDTRSDDFPVFAPFQPNRGSVGRGSDAFVTKVAPTGRALVYSSFYGGRFDESGQGIGVDSTGATWITGMTQSDNLIKVRPLQSQFDGVQDVFVAKLATLPSPTQVVFSSYLGGSTFDWAQELFVDQNDAVYITGWTESADFPTANAVQRTLAGGRDAYLAEINPSASTLVFSTFLGGSGGDEGQSVTVDSDGFIYTAGFTGSANFPTENAYQAELKGESDGYVVALRPGGRTIEFASFLGGSNRDEAYGVAVDFAGNAYVTGITYSDDFPEFYFFQSGGLNGLADAFVSKIVGIFELTFEPPDPNSNDPSPPPRRLTARRTDRVGGAGRDARPTALEVAAPRRASLIGYKVYRSATPNVQPNQSNLYTTLPPSQTMAPGVPGGAFFAVTACYDDGSESAPSEEASGGAGEASISNAKATASKITVTGEKFTSTVQVYLDGIPFSSAAKVKKNGAKVVQKGTLITGQSVGAYLSSHSGRGLLSIQNSNGGIATFSLR